MIWKRAYGAIVKMRRLIFKANKGEKEKEKKEGDGRSSRSRKSDQVGVIMTWTSGEDAHTTDGLTLQAVALADSLSCGHIPRYLWRQARFPVLMLTSR